MIPGGRHGGFPEAEMDRAYEAITAFLKEQIGIAGP